MSVNVQLEPEAQEFAKATANPPYLFDLGPEKGRPAVDEVQAGPVNKLPVEIEDRTIAGGPSGQRWFHIIENHAMWQAITRGRDNAPVTTASSR